jgi:hypothetical protein
MAYSILIKPMEYVRAAVVKNCGVILGKEN